MSRNTFNLPLWLHHRGIYYGWVVLFAGTVGLIMSVPGQTMGVSVYTEFLIKNLALDRVKLSTAYMFGTFGSALCLPLAGKLLDSAGSRFMGFLSALGLAAFLYMLSCSPEISGFLVSTFQFHSRWVSFAVAFVCFLGIRHFGQGQLTMASRTMMGLWFAKRRGTVLGLSGTFVAFGFGVAPLVLTKLINTHQWKASLYWLSFFSLGMALFALALFRRSPEHYGLEVDGGLLSTGESNQKPVVTERSFTAKEAKGTRTFWIFNFGMMAQALLVTGITFHMGHIGKLNGMTSAKAFSVFLPLSVFSVSFDLLAGFLSDRIPLKYLLSFMQLGLMSGLLCFQFYGTPLGYWGVAMGLGASNGIFSLLNGAAWPKLFGRQHLGSIAGLVMGWMVAGSALGPFLFSLGESLSGGYTAVIYLCALIPFFIFGASFFANSPQEG